MKSLRLLACGLVAFSVASCADTECATSAVGYAVGFDYARETYNVGQSQITTIDGGRCFTIDREGYEVAVCDFVDPDSQIAYEAEHPNDKFSPTLISGTLRSTSAEAIDAVTTDLLTDKPFSDSVNRCGTTSQ